MKLRILLAIFCAAPVFSMAQSSSHCSGPSISTSDMREVRESVAKPSADEDRMRVAKNITNAHCLTSEQVTVICRELSSEAARLEFAKFAIDHTTDPENYSKTFSVFKSDASKRELSSLVKERL